MEIDENKIQLDISDHNLIRAWFSVKKGNKENWKEKKYETRTYYKVDKESLGKMENELMKGIRKNTPFNNSSKNCCLKINL